MSNPQDPWPPEYPPPPGQQPQQYYQQPPPTANWPGQQQFAPPPGPVWPPPPGPGVGAARPRKRSRVPVFVGLAASVVALLVVISAIFIVWSKSAAADVRLEPVKTQIANPFMDNVGTDEPAAAESPTPPAATGKFAADTPGLYGGTMNNSSCDRDKMLKFLKDNTDKGRAWAGVLGVPFADLDSYFADLTPVVLRVDTAVTNHGFENGKATTLQSVLQAGTAVLVDKYGKPVAKCYCGNPLTPPASYSKPKYTGQTWSRFTKEKVVVVQPTTVIIETFVLVDVQTNKPFDRRRATTGDSDVPSANPPKPSATSTAAASPTPSKPAPTSKYTQDDAIKLFNERDQSCASVQYPWPAATHVDVASRPGSAPGVFILTFTHDNGTRVFEFSVDIANQRVAPANELAAEAARYCPAFNR